MSEPKKAYQPRKSTATEIAESIVNASGGTVSNHAKELVEKAANGEISYDDAVKLIIEYNLGSGSEKATG